MGRTGLLTHPRVPRRRLAAATVEAIGTGLRRAQVNRMAQFLREVATEADRRPIVRHSTCGSRSCNRVLRADILAALARHQVTVAEAEAATLHRVPAAEAEAAMLHRATAAVVDTRHRLAAEAITVRLVTVVAEAAATVRLVVVTVAATAHPAAMVAAIAAVGVADTLLEAEAGVADTLLEAEAAALLPAAVVIPLEEITAAITKQAAADC